MGINNLNKFLRAHCPEVFVPTHLSEYAYKKLAIDTSLYMCKYKYACKDNWLHAFLKLVAALRKNEVHCIFVYDTSAPVEKELERQARAEQRQKTEDTTAELEAALEHYNNTKEISDLLRSYQKRIQGKVLKSLLGPDTEPEFNPELVKEHLEKRRANIISLTPEDYALSRKLFDALKIPYILAPMEAETTCADLCRQGLVDAVLSEDTDVLAYGAPVFLSKIETYTGECVSIQYDKVLEALDLTEAQFLDFCIMCGCDYNTNVPKVGPETAYRLIKKFGTIDDITGYNLTPLRHVRTRELFTMYEKVSTYVPYCGHPDFDEVEQLLIDNGVRGQIYTLQSCFTNDVVIVESDEEEIILELDE